MKYTLANIFYILQIFIKKSIIAQLWIEVNFALNKVL